MNKNKVTSAIEPEVWKVQIVWQRPEGWEEDNNFGKKVKGLGKECAWMTYVHGQHCGDLLSEHWVDWVKRAKVKKNWSQL